MVNVASDLATPGITVLEKVPLRRGISPALSLPLRVPVAIEGPIAISNKKGRKGFHLKMTKEIRLEMVPLLKIQLDNLYLLDPILKILEVMQFKLLQANH
eukprot:TRINITY_DN20599_c1_g1_i9.p1 TRINITY_DN20599_c1_g1~~TRINITY_DN20599_c1_g1_i9.p1  ORF type:complete len:100 (-),score=21.73 TRINITY_DN20599_c1_g1_i9:209-508(-)